MKEEIDWKKLAEDLELLAENKDMASSKDAATAIELLIGKEKLSASVDYYVAERKGSELARAVLWLLHPWSAMKRCYEIYRSSGKPEHRASAIELLRVVADKRALKWVNEFLEDPNPTIQNWGIGIVDQLIFSGRIYSEDAAQLIEIAERHDNENVREVAKKIKGRPKDA